MRRLITVMLIGAATCTAAQASQQGILVTKNWRAMDKCSREAQTAFPDYTAEANAKREAKLKDCLAGKNLPPRAPQQ